MKTREEVEYLKDNWAGDPCWDIESTEGFEEYRDELLAFKEKMEIIWEERHEARMRYWRKLVGVCDNDTLVNIIIRLDEKIGDLEERVRKIEEWQ